MIKEVYVSYETSKLLKEKGFSSDDCHTAYDEDKVFFWYGDYSKDRKGIVDAPTQALAMKWLREVHHLFIGVEPRLSFTDYYWITANVYRVRKKNSLYHAEPVDDYSCVACCDGDSFEDACGAAIKYCLEKLI